MKILMIEDDVNISFVLERFTEQGHKVECCFSLARPFRFTQKDRTLLC